MLTLVNWLLISQVIGAASQDITLSSGDTALLTPIAYQFTAITGIAELTDVTALLKQPFTCLIWSVGSAGTAKILA